MIVSWTSSTQIIPVIQDPSLRIASKIIAKAYLNAISLLCGERSVSGNNCGKLQEYLIC